MDDGGRGTNLKGKATRLHRLAEVFARSCLVEAIKLEQPRSIVSLYSGNCLSEG